MWVFVFKWNPWWSLQTRWHELTTQHLSTCICMLLLKRMTRKSLGVYVFGIEQNLSGILVSCKYLILYKNECFLWTLKGTTDMYANALMICNSCQVLILSSTFCCHERRARDKARWCMCTELSGDGTIVNSLFFSDVYSEAFFEITYNVFLDTLILILYWDNKNK